MVRDLFGSMPVRVKQRPAASTDRANIDQEWSHLVHETAGLLLSWPSSVSVLLREGSGQREIRLRTPSTSDSVARASSLLIQASLADSGDAEFFVPVSASTSNIRLTGCISTRPVATRRAQFVSLGVQPLANDHGTNLIHEEINRVFSNSSFAVHDADLEESMADGKGSKEKGSRRRAERWPMFCLRIQIRNKLANHDLDDLFDDRGNHLSAILDLIRTVCYGFLKKHHLRPKKVAMSRDHSRSSSVTLSSLGSTKQTRQSSRDIQTTPSVRNPLQSRYGSSIEIRPSNYQSPFDGWQRIKVGHATLPISVEKGESQVSNTHDSGLLQTDRLVGEGGRLLRQPFADPDETLQESSHFIGSGILQASEDSRPASVCSHTISDTPAPAGLAIRPQKRDSAWLQNLHDNWENPIFQTVPPPIPRLHDDHGPPPDNVSTGVRSKFFDNGAKDCGVTFEAGSMSLQGRISKNDLAGAEVIAQVDRKFILVKMPLRDGERTDALIMLDQHAVDERCQLEDLMRGYFTQNDTGAGEPIHANVETLDKPFLFDLGDQELNLLQRYQAYFSAWGIIYDVQRSRKRVFAGPPNHLSITALPPSILERCTTEPRLLIDLLRREAWDLSEAGRQPTAPFLPFVAKTSWISNFHRCPRGLLDLLHSRSCRSAVMFNDVLTKEECVVLLGRLAQCTFPFQCAHGRPSMAPLVDLGVGSRVGGWSEEGRALVWNGWMDG